MNIKIKDPYYSYEDRVNGMISIAFRHTTRQSRQSEGNRKSEDIEPKNNKRIGVDNKKLSLKLRITDSIKRSTNIPDKIKCVLNGEEATRTEITDKFQTSTMMIGKISKEYETIFIGEDRIDFIGYNPKGNYTIYKHGVIIEKDLEVEQVSEYLGISIKNAYHRAYQKNTDKNGYMVINQRREG